MAKITQPAIQDSKIKRQRVRDYLFRKKLDGVIITTREHFTWMTSGGDNHVVRPTNIGFGAIVITKNHQYIIAHSMDADRLIEEQVKGQGFELVKMCWYEGDIRLKAMELAGQRVGSDTNLPGAEDVYMDLVDLHYPMTDLEVERIRWLGRATDGLFYTMAQSIKPGETEIDIAARLLSMHASAGLEVDGMIVGSDERCFKYRHPMATEKRLEKYLMLHSVARKWGLHSNLTRFLHFGPIPEKIRKIYDCAAGIEARIFLTIEPGLRFSEILRNQKKWYQELGFKGEWKNHFQGGPTGYIIADGGRALTDKVVQVKQSYEWFITVTGTKTGELSLLTENGLEISSYIKSSWPGLDVSTPFGDVRVPNIMVI